MKSKLVLLSPFLFVIMFPFMPQPEKSQSTADATPIPTIEVAAEMEAVPTDCGILAEEMAIDPMIQGIGTWPIWVALPNEAGDTRGILTMPTKHYQVNPELEGWWSTKVAWFIPKTYSGEVRLQGFNVRDNSPIYFEFDELTTLAILNPDEPGGFADGLEAWAFFPSYMWVSKAGCYRLQAEWDSGLWQQIIAVGRTET